MRDEYDFSAAIANPYIKPQKSSVTIRLDNATIAYFKSLSEETHMPYQTLINAYLTDCATKKVKPHLEWR